MGSSRGSDVAEGAGGGGKREEAGSTGLPCDRLRLKPTYQRSGW